MSAMLSRQDNLAVCGEASDADSALAQIAKLNPDLVILDMSLKSGTGLDVIKQLRSNKNGHADRTTAILVHSMYEDSLYAERVLQAGAMGYVNKQESPETVLSAIRRVLSGKVYLSPELTQRLLDRSVGHQTQLYAEMSDRLTDRELEIFRLIGEAVPTGAIAERLFLSVHTIETHRQNIKKKLGIKNASELNQRAVQWVLENG
jgi:DNA-binding NarL/FixJ family response regulator